jgi:hypothetical protein
MSEQTGAPDVAAILEALRGEVRAQRAAQGAGESGTALSAIERELHHAAEQLEITRVVSAHWPLEGKGLYERGWAAVHKVVRRALKWYIPPIVEQQNAFNDTATRSLRLLIEAHAELRDQLAELRRQLEQALEGDDQRPTTDDGSPPPPAARRPPEQAPFVEQTAAAEAAPPTAELQQLVERNGRAEPPAPLPDLGLRQIARELDERKAVSAHWDLGGGTPLATARALVQRVIRQYLRWMVNPIVEQQNAFNEALAGAAPRLLAADGELRARAAQVRAQGVGNRGQGAAAARGGGQPPAAAR